MRIAEGKAHMFRLRVKEEAEKRGLSMAKLSRISDVSYNTMQVLFRHPHHDVSLYILDRIAQALDISICDLIDENPQEKSN
jgi:DNA-binding Xre family transcriptional regulator